MKRYEALAEDIALSIRTGILKRGEKLPSVRQTSERRGISQATVYQAYYLLEARGLIRARERSGYYVIAGASKLPPEPELLSSTSGDSTTVDVSELIFEVLQSTKVRDVVPLGSAFPSPSLFPYDKLASSMHSSLQQLDPWATVEDLTTGSSELRRQIALRYLLVGMHVNPDDILITNGALEALNLALFAVTRPGDAVIIESPAFYGALQSLERMGLKAIEVATHPREGIDLDALESALGKHQPKACWLMTNFQNPLGCSMPDQKKQNLVALLERFQVPLIEDDVYAELYFSSHRPLPAKAFDQSGLVLHCSSFSKSLAPGFRIGWILGGRYLPKLIRQKLSSSLSASLPAQEAIAHYLSKGYYDNHLRRLRHTLSVQQSVYTEAIARYLPAGTLATRPSGGYVLWLELALHVDVLHLQKLAIALGISIAPGPMFSAQRQFRHCLRLNYGHPYSDKTAEAMQTLGRLIQQQSSITV
ncbi:PLP-dependent aminotransferase family protein [Undibacterium rugosum]|uniref:aminotransferase-like domain-containing protein n=1 Tax=Undibacterium rugosum TaxID=2762291 RepID=UPI001B818FB9|nr:PLP-dependent aminotransferase family protein [Undibacterium rugosum]MBR7776883.1 PLP-dependent aminotransferase family protein [Undibacterium rugosum]